MESDCSAVGLCVCAVFANIDKETNDDKDQRHGDSKLNKSVKKKNLFMCDVTGGDDFVLIRFLR